MSTAADRYRAVREEVPAEATIIVVTKFHPVGLVRELAEAGARDFGENRHQEAAAKAAELRSMPALDGPPPRWHFVGQLQSNKAKAVLEYADVIHSLDRESLLAPLRDSGVGAFIQVNLTEDPARGGVPPGKLPAFVERVLETPGIRLLGLMAVAGLGAEPRREFARVRALRDEAVLPIAPQAAALSMGMSGDWREALAEGATHLRIGTAITGNRPGPAYART